jgi:hypothetical protein
LAQFITFKVFGSEKNNKQCLIALATYYKQNNDIDKMVVYYKKLIQHKNPEAFYELAILICLNKLILGMLLVASLKN